MENFHDKVVFVTGASRGIGRAVAIEFAKNGARLGVHYRENLSAAAETLAQLSGHGHTLFQADLLDLAGIPSLVTTVIEQMGKIDILINNAGIFDLHPPVETDFENWDDVWKRTLNLNLFAPAYLSHAVAQHMQEQGGGKIINISSRGAFRGEPDAPAYGSSKAGLNALSQSLAKALAPHGIFVYAVAPGFVETEMTQDMLESPAGIAIRNESPLGRVALPEEVARTVLFLAGEGTEFLTGDIIDVNGASYLRS